MEEITLHSAQLPDNLPELSRFALIGREKLNAVRAEIRAIEKVGLAQEVHQQKLQEAQEIAEAVLDAEVQIGKLTAEMPKATNGGANQYGAKSATVRNEQKSKSEALKEAGIKQDTAERFERLAKHPEAVAEAKAIARERGEVVTRSSVNAIIAANAPRPPKKNTIVDATIRHMEYKENKVATIEDAKQDANDRELLARRAVTDLQGCISKITTLTAFNDGQTFKDIEKVYSTKDRMQMIDSLKRCISSLSIICRQLYGGMNEQRK